MRRVPVAVLALLGGLATPALSSPVPGCAVIADPSGDVAVAGAPQSAGLVGDAHADVLAVGVASDRGNLVVSVGASDLDANRKGTWVVSFTSRGKRVSVEAGSGMWLNLGASQAVGGFFATVDGGRKAPVSGTIDYNADVIRIVVPVRALGAAAPSRGTTLAGFRVVMTEQLVNVGAGGGTLTLTDAGESAAKHAFGRGC